LSLYFIFYLAPFDSKYWEVPQIRTQTNTRLKLSGVSITGISDDESITLHLEPYVGTVSFRDPDGLSRNNGSFSSYIGKVGDFNRALNHLYYSPLEQYIGDDILIIRLSIQNKSPLQHERKIMLSIYPQSEMQDIVLSSSVYHVAEDTGFQFPKLNLGFFSSKAIRPLQSNVRRYSLVASQFAQPDWKFNNSSNQTNNWRHRQVANFDFIPPENFCILGNNMYFTASDEIHGTELWVSDGSMAGTKVFLDLMPGRKGSNPSFLTPLNGNMIFSASAIDLSWKLDDPLCGGLRQSSIFSNVYYVVSQSNIWNPQRNYDCPAGFRWLTTKEGISLFTNERAESKSSDGSYVFWNKCGWKGYDFGGYTRKYFRFADSHSSGSMKHAGSDERAPMDTNFAISDFAGIVCIKSKVDDGNTRALWLTDGSIDGTRRIHENRGSIVGSNPKYLTKFGEKELLFQAETDAYGVELYKTDGTASGTALVEDIWKGPRSSNPMFFAVWSADNRVYFAATTDYGTELWVSDGYSSFTQERSSKTSSANVGTYMVKDICVGTKSSDPRFIVGGSSKLFFSADDCLNGRELWISDGTTVGTHMVTDLNPLPGIGSDPTSLTIFSGKVYFQAEADKSTGRELYMSDGTAQGTLLLVDLSPGPSSSFPSQLTVLPFFSKRGMLVGHYMYFTANKSGKINLWRLDSSFVSQPIQILSDSFTSNWILNESQSPKQNLPFFFYNQELYFTAQSSSYTNSVQESVVEDYRLQVKVSRGNIITSNRYDTVNPLSKGLWITSSPLDDLQPTLESLVYVPPQNWNSESQEGDHILSWSLNFTRGEKSSFKSGYLWVSPRNDPPVINVPTAVYNYNQRTGDYNSLLRMICSPIYVNEDSSFLLSEFSVEAIDSMRFEGEDKFYSMRIAISANIGRIEASSLDCVDMIESCTIDSVCFDATPLCINTIFQNIMYIPKPNFSGNDYLTIMVSAPSGLSDKAVVPLWIQEVNDAPYVVGQRQFYVGEDVPSIVSELLIIDPDNKTEEIIVVSLRVDKGSIFILNNSSIAYNSEPSGTTISFQGTIDNINIAVSKIVFTSYKDWNSISGDLGTVYATIFVSLTDSEKFNSTSTSVIHIMVEPTSDPAIISLPKNLKTDVMISSANHVLHCKEDSWLAIEGFNFSSSDANIDLSITVEIRVGHGALHLMTESGITFEKGTSNFKSNIVITGTLFYVNEAITALKYKPNLDYFGTDTMDISGFSIDEYTKQVSISADKQIMIIIHPVNDAPIWLTPNVLTLNVTGNDLFPTLIRGVRFTDVDCTGSNACEMELSIESTHGFIHLPNAKGSNFFITDYPARNNFIALSGNYEDLNRIIDEVIFVLDEVNYYSITDGERNQIGITFSIDDKANTGIGGSFVVSTTLSLSPLFWSKSYLSLKVPSSVLVLVEDEVLLFGDKIEVINQHADRSLRSLVGVTVHVSHGMFFLSSDDGIDILRNASEEIIFQGAIAKVNAALQDSYYIPSADWFGTDVIRIEVYNERDLNDSRSIYIEVEPACNEVTLDIQQSEFVTDEDTEIIIAGIKLKHREARFEEQSIEISISVSNGGVKLLLWENLIVLDAEQMIDQIDNKMGSSETVISHSQKYFSKMTLLGNPKQLEASMSSMSYIPKRNFNTFGRCPDEILLTSKSSCSLLKPFIGGIQIVVLPVNDPPQLIAPFVFPMLFPKIPSRDPNNGHNYLFSSNAIEIMNSSSVLLKSIRLIDPDLDDEDDDLSLQVTIDSHHGQVSVNCSNEHIQAVFVPNINKSGITMKGNLKSLNSMLQCLTFKNTKKYKGDAFIAITVSDLGNTGKGNEHHESYVIPLKIGDMKGNFSLDTSYCSEEVEVPLISVEERKSIGLRCPGYDDPNKYINTKLESNQWTLAVIRPLTYQDVDDSMAHNSKLRIETIKTFPGASSYSDVSFLVQLKGKLLFRAKDELGGEELWESDGTSNGTLILKDLFPGPRGSNPGYITKYVSKDIVLFAADGLDLSWRIKSSWRDKCNGFRQSRHNENAFYVVSALNIWDKEKVKRFFLTFFCVS
jgi:ELWxxDGT repeat protein